MINKRDTEKKNIYIYIYILQHDEQVNKPNYVSIIELFIQLTVFGQRLTAVPHCEQGVLSSFIRATLKE